MKIETAIIAINNIQSLFNLEKRIQPLKYIKRDWLSKWTSLIWKTKVALGTFKADLPQQWSK